MLVDGRFPLRGAIDAIDVHRQTGVLRVTDHKTGKDRTKDTLVIGGGSVLQPLVYAAVAETMLGVPVGESRLFFCTSAAGFKQRPVLLDAGREASGDRGAGNHRPRGGARHAGAGPAQGACAWCEFRPVCGPGGEHRVARKPQAFLEDLRC